MAEQSKRIFLEFHTYLPNTGIESRVLLNVDTISGILATSNVSNCKSTILLNGSFPIDIVEDYDTIIDKIQILKNKHTSLNE